MASTTFPWPSCMEALVKNYFMALPHNDSHQLQTPPGLWYDDLYMELASVPHTLILFHHQDRQWQADSHFHRYPEYILYNKHASLTITPQATVPATPTIMAENIKLVLPIPALVKPAPLNTVPLPLATWLVIHPESGAKPLWENIWSHGHTDTLWSALISNLQIILASDVVVHPNGSGTCTWAIWAGKELWMGECHTPGPPIDVYSSLAEAYGMYTVLSFLQNYIWYFPLSILCRLPIHAYFYNNGLIKWLNHTKTLTYPHDAIQDDYPIYAEIWHIVQLLQPLTIHFHHVQGHQDTKATWPLKLPEHLNTDCDACAANLSLPDQLTYL